MTGYESYQYVVVNDDLEGAGRRIQAIATAARLATSRNLARVAEIMESFGGPCR